LALDTSAYSHLRRGHPTVIDWVASAEVVELPAIVLGELEAGFRIGRRYRENSRVLADFLEEPFVKVRPVDEEVSRRYARIFADLRRAGTPIPVNDIWIAATAMESGAHLVTFDGDFARVAGLAHTLLK
jgi:tRNA(fMet)-specific endonuclease VapC